MEEVLPSSHPYYEFDPFGIRISQTSSISVGGDPAEVFIFWGNERVENFNTATDPDDNSSWDYKINLSNSADIGFFETTITENLIENKQYFFRAYAKNVAGEVWADEIYGFETVDTEISRYTLDGLILWLDATDINGDGEKDNLFDKSNIPLWVDKSLSEKDATQNIISQMPLYDPRVKTIITTYYNTFSVRCCKNI